MSTRVCSYRTEDKFLYVQQTSTQKFVILAKIWLFMEEKPGVTEEVVALTCSSLRACVHLFLNEGESLEQFGLIPVPDGVAYLTTKPLFRVDSSQIESFSSVQSQSAHELE